MERRVLGIATLVATLLLAVSLSNLIAAPVAGAPVAAAIPGPPAVGDCLLEQPNTDERWNGPTGPPPPSLAFGSCDGPHYGEAVIVLPDITELTADETMGGCWADDHLWRYLGMGGDVQFHGAWLPAGMPWDFQTGPTEYQRAAGQRWLSCWAVAPGEEPRPYRGSLRGAVASGHIPPELALCTNELQLLMVDGVSVSCADPHRYEVLAYTWVGGPGMTQERLDESCGWEAARMTQMPDPTAGGALLVSASAYRYDDTGYPVPGLPASANEHGQAACVVSAVDDRLLSASLLGLGTDAVPWA